MGHFINRWQTWLGSAVLFVGALAVAIIAHRIIFAMARRISRRSPTSLFASVVRYAENPARFIFLLAVTAAVLPGLPVPPPLDHAAEHIAGLGLIACVGWLLIALVEVFDELVAIRHSIDVRDNLAARR